MELLLSVLLKYARNRVGSGFQNIKWADLVSLTHSYISVNKKISSLCILKRIYTFKKNVWALKNEKYLRMFRIVCQKISIHLKKYLPKKKFNIFVLWNKKNVIFIRVKLRLKEQRYSNIYEISKFQCIISNLKILFLKLERKKFRSSNYDVVLLTLGLKECCFNNTRVKSSILTIGVKSVTSFF